MILFLWFYLISFEAERVKSLDTRRSLKEKGGLCLWSHRWNSDVTIPHCDVIFVILGAGQRAYIEQYSTLFGLVANKVLSLRWPQSWLSRYITRPVASQPGGGGGGVWTWMGGTPGAPPPPLGHCPRDVINLKNAPTLGHSQAPPPPLGIARVTSSTYSKGGTKLLKGGTKLLKGGTKLLKGGTKAKWTPPPSIPTLILLHITLILLRIMYIDFPNLKHYNKCLPVFLKIKKKNGPIQKHIYEVWTPIKLSCSIVILVFGGSHSMKTNSVCGFY